MVLLAGIIVISGMNFMLYLGFINKGIIYPANYIERLIETYQSDLQTVHTIQESDIPDLSDYVLFSNDGAYIEGSLDKNEAQIAWRVSVSGKRTEDNKYYYSTIQRDNELLVLRYRIAAQFSNPTLRKLFPIVDILFLIALFFQLIVVIILLSFKFGRYLSRKIDSLLEITKSIEQQDLDFKVTRSGVFEIDQVMDAMEQMKEALKTSLYTQWQEEVIRQEQFSALTHDLKTPLTIIKGNTDLLSETQLDDEQKECTTYISKSTVQIESYIKTLMEISQTHKAVDVQYETVNLDGFFKDLKEQVLGITLPKQIKMTWCINPYPETIEASYSLLLRALMNIFSNAVDFTPENEEIIFRVEMLGENLELKIIDKGSGFSKKALENATNQFFMDDQSRGSKTHYGLGLYIAQNIISQHNGEMKIENSNITGGAQVTITMPL